MRLSPEARSLFRSAGRRGGQSRARRLKASTRSMIAALAGTCRGLRRRGLRSFEETGYPGGEILDAGLRDMARGQTTEDALAVAEVAPLLRTMSLPFPRALPFSEDPRRALYRRIEDRVGPDMAHADFNAKLQRLFAFVAACDAADA